MDTKITFKAEQTDEYPYLIIEVKGGYVAICPKAIVVQYHRPLTVKQDNLTRITISLEEEN